MQRGLVCSLTNEYATFDEKCTDFEADETAIAKELTKQREYKEELQKTGGVRERKTNCVKVCIRDDFGITKNPEIVP